jgi:hypothetical protein
MEINIADEASAGRFKERCQLRIGFPTGKNGKTIIVTDFGQVRIRIVIYRQTKLILASADKKKAVEIQERICQQRFTPQLIQRGGILTLPNGVELFEIFFPVRIFFAKRFGKMTNGGFESKNFLFEFCGRCDDFNFRCDNMF